LINCQKTFRHFASFPVRPNWWAGAAKDADELTVRPSPQIHKTTN
jgi:hypothetical protein